MNLMPVEEKKKPKLNLNLTRFFNEKTTDRTRQKSKITSGNS